MQGHNYLKTEAPLSVEQLNYIFLGLLRFKDLFNLASTYIKIDHFDNELEIVYRLIWKTALKINQEKGPAFLFDDPNKVFSLFQLELSPEIEKIKNNKYIIDSLYGRNNEKGILNWIYETDINEININLVTDYLKKFLNHRIVQEPLRAILNSVNRNVISEIPNVLKSLADTSVSISSLNTQFSKTPTLDNLIFEQTPFESTGVGFLDHVLSGGQLPGEVYGVLGAYGSGKTLFSVQIACGFAINQVTLYSAGQIQEPKHSFIFHYEANFEEMAKRVIAHISEISWEELQTGNLNNLSSETGPIFIKDYEKKYWAKDIAKNNGVFKPERQRLEIRSKLYNHYIHLVDMSGTNPQNPKMGCGYVQEIANILAAETARKKIQVGSVVIDYAGLCCKRYIADKGIKPENLRYFLGDFGDRCRQLIAIPMKCSVWVMHQLAAAANKRTDAYLAHHADAAEAKNFVENMVYAFNLGVPNAQYRTVTLNVTKARRSSIKKPVFLWINGLFQRLEPGEKYFIHNLETGDVIPRENVDSPLWEGEKDKNDKNYLNNYYQGINVDSDDYLSEV